MTRKLFYAGLGWLLGICCFISFGAACVFIGLCALCVAVAVLLIYKNSKAVPKIVETAYLYLKYFCVTTVFFIAAAAFGNCYYIYRYQSVLSYADAEITVNGVVTDITYSGGDSVLLKVKGKINGKTYAKISFFTTDKDYGYYDEVTAVLTAAEPENTVDFNANDYNRAIGVYLTGSGSADCAVTGECRNRFMRAVKLFRDDIVGKICTEVKGDAGGFLAASFCSDKSKLSGSAESAVYRAGLGHLFAVSGTHIVIIASFLETTLKLLVASKRLRSAAVVTVVWCFALFAGLTASATRAAIMMSFYCAGEFFLRKSDCANSLGAAAILITAQNPFAVTSASFIMSFAATFAIGVVSPAICKGRIQSRTGRTLVSYLCINICSTPICALIFTEVSLTSAATNLFLIPVCTASLILTFIFAATAGRLTAAVKLAGILSKAVIYVCRLVSGFDFTYAGTYYGKLMSLAAAIPLISILYYALKKGGGVSDILKFTAVHIGVCAAFAAMGYVGVGDRLVIIPDSKGYSAIVMQNGKALLFDMGASADDYYVISQYFEQMNVSEASVFLTDDCRFCYDSYTEHLSVAADFYSGGYCDDRILPVSETDGVSYEDGGYSLIFGDRYLTLNEGTLTIDGKTVCADDLEEVTIIVCR